MIKLNAVSREPERGHCGVCHMLMSIAETAKAKAVLEETGGLLQHPYHRADRARLERLKAAASTAAV